MTPTFQTRFGTEGNCWAACLATIFDVPLVEVDDCACSNKEWWENSERFLARQGCWQLQVEAVKEGSGIKWPFTSPPINTLCCIYGRCRLSKLNHIVVARVEHKPAGEGKVFLEFQLVHDPLNVGPDVIEETYGAVFFPRLFDSRGA